MTQEQKAYLAAVVFPAMAEIAGKSFSTQALISMVEGISDLDYVSVTRILSVWWRTERGFPFPVDIRDKIMPENSSNDEANALSNLIISGVGKFGYTNLIKAKESIGELGWQVVSGMGGWRHLCEVLTPDNEGIFRAQIRDYAKVLFKKSIRSQSENIIKLPYTANPTLDLINNWIAKK